MWKLKQTQCPVISFPYLGFFLLLNSYTVSVEFPWNFKFVFSLIFCLLFAFFPVFSTLFQFFFSFHLTFEISFFHFICLVIFFSSNALFPISQKKTLFFLLPPTFLYIKRLKLTFQRYTQFNGANLILSFNKYSCLSLMKLNISPSTMQ